MRHFPAFEMYSKSRFRAGGEARGCTRTVISAQDVCICDGTTDLLSDLRLEKYSLVSARFNLQPKVMLPLSAWSFEAGRAIYGTSTVFGKRAPLSSCAEDTRVFFVSCGCSKVRCN